MSVHLLPIFVWWVYLKDSHAATQVTRSFSCESKITSRFTKYFYIPEMRIFSYLSAMEGEEGVTYDFNRLRG